MSPPRYYLVSILVTPEIWKPDFQTASEAHTTIITSIWRLVFFFLCVFFFLNLREWKVVTQPGWMFLVWWMVSVDTIFYFQSKQKLIPCCMNAPQTRITKRQIKPSRASTSRLGAQILQNATLFPTSKEHLLVNILYLHAEETHPNVQDVFCPCTSWLMTGLGEANGAEL